VLVFVSTMSWHKSVNDRLDIHPRSPRTNTSTDSRSLHDSPEIAPELPDALYLGQTAAPEDSLHVLSPGGGMVRPPLDVIDHHTVLESAVAHGGFAYF
jgi:hypothetical protein